MISENKITPKDPQALPRLTIGGFRKARGEPATSAISVSVSGRPQILRFDFTQLTFGKRIWFLCPRCDRRCGILYEQESELACAKCHDVKYWMRAQHRNSHFESVVKPALKVCRIELQLQARMRAQKRRLLEDRLSNALANYRVSIETYAEKEEGMMRSLGGFRPIFMDW